MKEKSDKQKLRNILQNIDHTPENSQGHQKQEMSGKLSQPRGA